MRACSAVALACLIAILCSAADTGTVMGRVVSASGGVPLRDWTIDLFGVTDPQYRRTVTSGMDGSFSFADVPSGKYRVMEDEVSVSYLRHMETPDPPPLGEEVQVSSGRSAADITIKIEVGGCIQGTARGPDGHPVAGLSVVAERAATVDGLRRMLQTGWGSVTLEDGGYQITNLSPGKYSVVADLKRDPFDVGAPSRMGWLRTYYPSTVTVDASDVVSGIDIQMKQGPLYSIHGDVGGANAGLYRVFLQNGTDVTTLRMVNVESNGSFVINGVAPGRYSLDLVGTGRPATLQHTEVELTDHDLSHIHLKAIAAPEVTARLFGLDDANSARVKLFLRPTVNPTAPITFSHKSRLGIYTFESPSPEPNVLSALGLPPGAVIRSIKFNGRPAASLVVDLTNGGGEIDVVVGPAMSGDR